MNKIIAAIRKKNRNLRHLKQNEKRKEEDKWINNQLRPSVKYILETIKETT